MQTNSKVIFYKHKK